MECCLACGAGIDEYDSGYYARNMTCISCYVRKSSEAPMTNCSKCGLRIKQEEARSRRGGFYCGYCFSELERTERLPKCGFCTRIIEYYQESLKLSDGSQVHSSCAQTARESHLIARCAACGKETDHFKLVPPGKAICASCDRQGAARGAPILASLVSRIASMIS